MKGKVVALEDETPNVKTIRFEINDSNFSFLAGQWVLIGMEIEGERVERAYSISSSPDLLKENCIDITVKKIKGGKMSPRLHDLKVGDEVDVKGPFGKLVYDEEQKEVLLVAGGCGVAPLYSIAMYLVKHHPEVMVTMIYSDRNTHSIEFEEELKEMNDKYYNFKLVVTLTRVEDSEHWTGATGRVDSELLEEYLTDESFVYLCSSPSMAKSVLEALEELGVAKDRIKTEAY